MKKFLLLLVSFLYISHGYSSTSIESNIQQVIERSQRISKSIALLSTEHVCQITDLDFERMNYRPYESDKISIKTKSYYIVYIPSKQNSPCRQHLFFLNVVVGFDELSQSGEIHDYLINHVGLTGIGISNDPEVVEM